MAVDTGAGGRCTASCATRIRGQCASRVVNSHVGSAMRRLMAGAAGVSVNSVVARTMGTSGNVTRSRNVAKGASAAAAGVVTWLMSRASLIPGGPRLVGTAVAVGAVLRL